MGGLKAANTTIINKAVFLNNKFKVFVLKLNNYGLITNLLRSKNTKTSPLSNSRSWTFFLPALNQARINFLFSPFSSCCFEWKKISKRISEPRANDDVNSDDDNVDDKDDNDNNSNNKKEEEEAFVSKNANTSRHNNNRRHLKKLEASSSEVLFPELLLLS